MARILTIGTSAAALEPTAEHLEPTGFAAFDARLAASPGPIVLQVPNEAVARAAFAHAARRLLRADVALVSVPETLAAPLFVEVGRRLGVASGDSDAKAFAERIASRQRAERLAVAGPLPATGSWDADVARELATSGVWTFYYTTDTAEPAGYSDVVALGARLDEGERLAWTAAVAEASHLLLGTHDVLDLERRVQSLRHAPPAMAPASAEARAFAARLSLAARAWPLDVVTDLGGLGALEELVARGDVVVERDVVLVPAPITEGVTPAERETVADALLTRFPNDAWAMARAAVLLLDAGQPSRADALVGQAAKRLHGDARRELSRPWLAALDRIGDEATQRALLVTAAARALEAGDCEDALRLARRAMRGAAANPELSLLVAKAACAVGDLTQAKVALEEARAQTTGDAAREQVECELAEIAYLTGDHEQATRLASEIASRTTSAASLLAARGVEGKILLARGSYAEAEARFAEDAHAAERAGLGTPSRRARLNRAIALMMLGRLREARVLFEAVRDEGTREHDDQACAYALENLAVLAAQELALGTALGHLEQAFSLRRRQGDRVRMVRVLSNLAQFRRNLGLIEHAEHAIRFARHVGPSIPFDVVARLGLRAARLYLDVGATGRAHEEILRVLREGAMSRDKGRILAEAHRLSARLALEDGNFVRAREDADVARALADDAESEWEQSFLRALIDRAEGRLDAATVQAVVDRARGLSDYEFLCESLLLGGEVALADGDHDAARALLDECTLLRDRVLTSIATEHREAFLGQRLSRSMDALAAKIADRRVALDVVEGSLPPVTVRSPSSVPPRASREIIGEDPAIRALRAAIKRVARSDATVLIRGESGTGKELVAEALHRSSDRANGPLVTVNCAALVETLLLSELFGHEKGAFTGAASRRRGRFELAEGGTLFLDEIGDISPRTQVALLRVLQEKTFERVGGTSPIRANVRIVCATHRDLRAMVERGEFREDLYYRLRGITLEVPALRARLGDLPAIATSLLQRVGLERSEEPKSLTTNAIELLQRHRWPGNVRELENALRAASLFADGGTIDARDFVENVDDLRPLAASAPSFLPPPPASVIPLSRATLPSLPPIPAAEESGDLDVAALSVSDDEEGGVLPAGETGATAVAYACVRGGTVSLGDLKRQIERDCIARALAETKGNITRAAALLGMKRPRLSQLVKQYGFAVVSEGS